MCQQTRQCPLHEAPSWRHHRVRHLQGTFSLSYRRSASMLPMLSLGSPLAAAMMLTHISTHRSLVELVATAEQLPLYFVSHWWGEPVVDFVKCLDQHSTDRKLGANGAYWVCAYATPASQDRTAGERYHWRGDCGQEDEASNDDAAWRLHQSAATAANPDCRIAANPERRSTAHNDCRWTAHASLRSMRCRAFS